MNYLLSRIATIIPLGLAELFIDTSSMAPFDVTKALSEVLKLLPPEFVDMVMPIYKQGVAISNIILDEIIRALNSELTK